MASKLWSKTFSLTGLASTGAPPKRWASKHAQVFLAQRWFKFHFAWGGEARRRGRAARRRSQPKMKVNRREERKRKGGKEEAGRKGAGEGERASRGKGGHRGGRNLVHRGGCDPSDFDSETIGKHNRDTHA